MKSVLCSGGTFSSKKSLSEILGHANVSTTLQRYVHPSLDVKKEQMERLAKVSVRNRGVS